MANKGTNPVSCPVCGVSSTALFRSRRTGEMLCMDCKSREQRAGDGRNRLGGPAVRPS